MKFEWDHAKAAKNRRKHGVTFEEAKEVIHHPLSITISDLEHSQIDEREKTIGFSSQGRILVVIHTESRNETIRLISARKAERSEVDAYEEEIKWQNKQS
ncbi:MAG: BrnT family toxin [Phycisphaerales bacterium]|jgi:uncharacterized DUF497 family protein|nr:BrnT family toxin [Phycisphaerales bacterium]